MGCTNPDHDHSDGDIELMEEAMHNTSLVMSGSNEELDIAAILAVLDEGTPNEQRCIVIMGATKPGHPQYPGAGPLMVVVNEDLADRIRPLDEHEGGMVAIMIPHLPEGESFTASAVPAPRVGSTDFEEGLRALLEQGLHD